jgi:hypothetical protein
MDSRSPTTAQEVWKPFTMIDSVAIEEVFSLQPNTSVPIPTDGGRYDVNIGDRTKTTVYWKDECNDQVTELRKFEALGGIRSHDQKVWIPRQYH